MRRLFNVGDSKEDLLYPKESKPVTREEYDELIKVVTEFQNQVENYTSQLEAFKSDLATAFDTGVLSSNTAKIVEATINNLISDNINSKLATITSADIENIVSIVIRAGQVNAGDVTTELLNVTAQANFANLFAEGITAESIKTDSFNTTDLQVDNLKAEEAVIQKSTTSEADIGDAVIQNANITEAEIENANIEELASNSATIEDGEFGHIEVDFITHDTEFQTIDDTVTSIIGNYWIELPKIVNGWQRIVASKSSDLNDVVFAVENFNSVNNMRTHWSIVPTTFPIETITEFDVYENKLYLKCNTKESLKLFYISDDYSSQEVPKVYASDPLIGKEVRSKVVEYLNANYFWQHLETPDMEALKPLNLNSSTDYSNTIDENGVQYEGTESVTATYYKPNQDVNKEADTTFNSVRSTTTFKSPHLWIGDRTDWEDEKEDIDDYALVITDELSLSNP